MASSSVPEVYLDCSICTDKLKIPKTLPCLHSFCKKCLSNYITGHKPHKILKGFHCPTCRELTLVTDPNEPMSRWVDQFRTNFHLQEFVKAKTRSVSGRDFCKEHLDKTLELYCLKCKRALCGICAVKDHLECAEIESLENVVQGRRSKLDVLAARLQRVVDMDNAKQKNAEDYVWDLEKKERVMTTEVKEWERKVMYNIMKQTKIILEDMSTRIAEEMETVLQWNSSIDIKMKESKSVLDDITKLTKNSSMSPLGILSSSYELEARCSTLLESPEIPGPSPSTLTLNKSDWTEGNCRIGEVTLIKSTLSSELLNSEAKERSCSVLGETVSLAKAISCRSEKDKREPCLLDLIVLSKGNCLVVTDSSNTCVKSYLFVDDGAITCRLPLLNPRCVAVINDDMFVLTTESRNIYFFKVNKAIMTMESRIQIGTWYENKSCYGIARLPEDRYLFQPSRH